MFAPGDRNIAKLPDLLHVDLAGPTRQLSRTNVLLCETLSLLSTSLEYGADFLEGGQPLSWPSHKRAN